MHDRHMQLISGEKDGIVIPLYAALMSVWVTLFLEYLKREQACAAIEWGLESFEVRAYDMCGM